MTVMNRAVKFTIWHGFATSLALHSALALPFIVYRSAPPGDDLPTLIIELQGVISNQQTEERVKQQQAPEEQPPPPPSQETPPLPQEVSPTEPEDEGAVAPPEVQPQVPPPQAQQPALPQKNEANVLDEQQKAQVLKAERDLEADRVREYVKRLIKKVQANLVYPDEGRKAGLRGNATVSFRLTEDGQIRPGTLTIVTSSGRPELDASAIATVRASAPFDPPPREMAITFVVGYGKKK